MFFVAVPNNIREQKIAATESGRTKDGELIVRRFRMDESSPIRKKGKKVKIGTCVSYNGGHYTG